MLKKYLWLIFVISAAAHALSPDADSARHDLTPAPKHAQAAQLVAEVLQRHHYRAMPLDDAMSEAIYAGYLKSLDGQRLFFLQADIDQFSSLRDSFDDAILKQNLSAPYFIFNRYITRATERFAYARALLKDGFDFTQHETYRYRREKEPWAQSEAEIRDLWRKRVKDDWLRLRLAGKDSKEIVETLDRRYANYAKRLGKLTSDDAFQTFMNAYTIAVEPHTNYMMPRTAEDFDISMRLSLVGIGAVLADKNDYTTVRELIPGGPAALSGQLTVGDRIVGVGQGKNGAMTDVMGWRLDDTVALIRGAADTTVVLDILPANAGPDGKHKLVPLVRKKIALEEQAAKKSIIPVGDGPTARRIGVIKLPSFYDDFEGRKDGRADFKSATRDVARLLGELKAEKADAVLIDLRNNGGGSLTEAIDMTGLFVGKGPILQQRNAKGVVTVLNNTKSNVTWEGPVGVLINRGSASASEIFAAAIQDYGRGIIIGEPSFGKGTVQAMINLDNVARNDKPLFGELKFTVAQFFRINGGTTQLRGVTPDVAFPLAADPDDFGESSFDNALPWMQIRSADYVPAGQKTSLAPTLATLSEAREKSNRDFLCLKDTVAEFRHLADRKDITLNETERRQEITIQDKRLATCNATDASGKENGAASGSRPKNVLKDDGLQSDERSLTVELAEKNAQKDAKDALLEEAANILGDNIRLASPEAHPVASAAKPGIERKPAKKTASESL